MSHHVNQTHNNQSKRKRNTTTQHDHSRRKKYENSGHRRRLRDRALQYGMKTLLDYEILELLLGFTILQRDVKAMAKNLLASFGTLKDLIKAPKEVLKRHKLHDTTISSLKIIEELPIRMGWESMRTGTVFQNWEDLFDYCCELMRDLRQEQLRIVFLDSKYRVTKEEKCAEGTIDEITVYVRKIIERVLLVGAKSVILVHNHPSGDTKPSKADIELTRNIQRVLKAIDVNLHDHIIVGRKKSCYSFKFSGLLEE